MSIKYNQFGEVVSVNGIVTGQYLGKPMQDAVAERPEDNEPYAREQSIVTNSDKVDNDFIPPPMTGGVTSWNDLTDKPFGKEDAILFDGTVTIEEGWVGAPMPMLTEGDVYTVIYDEVEYSTTAVIGKWGDVYVGSKSLYDDGELADGEPPFVCTENFVAGMNGQHTITIRGKRYLPLDSKYMPHATNAKAGAVIFGQGANRAARVINTYFNATYDEIETAYNAHKNEGAVWKIAGDIVTHVSGGLNYRMYCHLWCGAGNENMVIITIDKDRNVTMDRAFDGASFVLNSPSGASWQITVSDDGTLSAQRLNN